MSHAEILGGKRFQEEMLLKGHYGWSLMIGGPGQRCEEGPVHLGKQFSKCGPVSSESPGSFPEMQIPSLIWTQQVRYSGHAAQLR